MDQAASDNAPRTWRSAAGAWLGIGTAPGVLVLGAQVGGRHGGDLPIDVLLIGGVLMVALLALQGRLGLQPPAGESASLIELASRYLPASAERAVTALLALAMVGWFGFNLGLGGAATAVLSGTPGAVGVALLAIPVVTVLLAGRGHWNAVAVVTTLSAITLVGVVAVKLAPAEPPVVVGVGGGALAADLAGYLGYVSVFAVRAPDFTVGLRGRGDLAWCVGLLVGPALAGTVVGAGVAASTGSTDIVEVLAGPHGLPVANLFVAAAVIAPTFAATYSGALAVRRLAGALSYRSAVVTIAVPGVMLAALRVDRVLLGWLTLLAATLPALIPPMVAEAARRRRGFPALPVPTWTWAPASGLALALSLAGYPAGAIAGLGVSVIATAVRTGATTKWRGR